MNTPTPETDKRIGIISNGSNIVDASWARQLEQELDEARRLITLLEDTPETYAELLQERDQLRKDLEFLKSKECEAAWCERWKRLCEENTQLRKVCDELSLHLKNHQDFCSGPVDSFDSSGAALHHYNSLPHVIAAKKGNKE